MVLRRPADSIAVEQLVPYLMRNGDDGVGHVREGAFGADDRPGRRQAEVAVEDVAVIRVHHPNRRVFCMPVGVIGASDQ